MVDSKSKKRLLVVTAILLVAIGYMVYSSSASSLAYFKEIDEVAVDDTFIGKNVRVGGLVQKGTIVQKGREYTFTIAKKEDLSKKMTVTYSKQMPSQFGPEVFVIAEGKLASKDKLEANSLVTQCPSKYESEKKESGGK